MRNKIEVCDKGPEENPCQPGTMWIGEKGPNSVFMIIDHGYVDLSKGVFYSSSTPKRDFAGYTQVYCVTIKRDRSG